MKPQLVSVDQLKSYVELDRSKDLKDPKYDIMKQSILWGGVKEPIWIFLNSRGKIHVAEGNTRIALALELGIKNVPAMVAYYDRLDNRNFKYPPKPVLNKRLMKMITRPSSLGFTKGD